MVGRGFEVVMALISFCCAPLHAVRIQRNRHKVPDFRVVRPLSLPSPDVFDDESQARSSPSTALGGYRVRVSQVTGKGLQIKPNAQQRLRCYQLREPPAALD